MNEHPLREWRLREGLSQEDLAELLGTTKSAVSRLETGARDASADVLRRIAEVTRNKVTPNDMLFAELELGGRR